MKLARDFILLVIGWMLLAQGGGVLTAYAMHAVERTAVVGIVPVAFLTAVGMVLTGTAILVIGKRNGYH